MYNAASHVYGRLHSTNASCSCSDGLILGDKWRGRVMARQAYRHGRN